MNDHGKIINKRLTKHLGNNKKTEVRSIILLKDITIRNIEK